MGLDGETMSILPGVDDALIPIEKFVDYALHPIKGKGKAYAFEKALGYDLSKAENLIDNIRKNLRKFKATKKGDNAYGTKYEVVMRLIGENGKSANILTSWIVEHKSGVTRLTSAYVTRRRIND